MKDTKAKLILHPVRMKIIQLLVNGKRMTVQKFAERMKDVPQATLYRQLNKLLEADLIQVVEEHQIRGTVEKVYALKEQTIHSQEDILRLSKEEHLNLFFTFQAQLMGQYEKYLEQEDIDLIKDGVTYRVANVYVTDEEYRELITNMASLLKKVLSNEPSPERKAKNIATIVIPENTNKKK